jgi:hypothetical protein
MQRDKNEKRAATSNGSGDQAGITPAAQTDQQDHEVAGGFVCDAPAPRYLVADAAMWLVFVASFLLLAFWAKGDEVSPSQEIYVAEAIEIPSSNGLRLFAFDQQVIGENAVAFNNLTATGVHVIDGRGATLLYVKPHVTTTLPAEVCLGGGGLALSLDGRIAALHIECRVGRLYSIKATGENE